jgi:hypothetical protein
MMEYPEQTLGEMIEELTEEYWEMEEEDEY